MSFIKTDFLEYNMTKSPKKVQEKTKMKNEKEENIRAYIDRRRKVLTSFSKNLSAQKHKMFLIASKKIDTPWDYNTPQKIAKQNRYLDGEIDRIDCMLETLDDVERLINNEKTAY